MNHYEEYMNAMWEEVEGDKKEPVLKQTDEEKWKQFVDEFGKSGAIIQKAFGVVAGARFDGRLLLRAFGKYLIGNLR